MRVPSRLTVTRSRDGLPNRAFLGIRSDGVLSVICTFPQNSLKNWLTVGGIRYMVNERPNGPSRMREAIQAEAAHPPHPGERSADR